MGQFPLSSNHKSVGSPLKLPNRIIYLAIDGLIFALINWSIDEVETGWTSFYLFSLVDVAHSRLVLVLMSF